MKRIGYVLSLLVALVASGANAQLTLTGAGKGAPGGGGVDSATTAWVNAVTGAGGSVSGTQQTRVDTLIKALKAHGLWTQLDYVLLGIGESDVHQGTIDLVNLTAATRHGSTTLAAAGWTGGGAGTDYIDTGYNPSGSGNYKQNSASLLLYVTNNRTTSQNWPQGVWATNAATIMPLLGGTAYLSINDAGNQLGATRVAGLGHEQVHQHYRSD